MRHADGYEEAKALMQTLGGAAEPAKATFAMGSNPPERIECYWILYTQLDE